MRPIYDPTLFMKRKYNEAFHKANPFNQLALIFDLL